MKKIIILLVFLTMISIAHADTDICFGTNISQHTYLRYNSTGDLTVDLVYNETCPFDCNNVTNVCNDPDPLSASLYGIALLFVAAIFIAAAIKSSAGFVFRGLEIEYLQPLFFTFAFMIVLTAFTVMISGSMAFSMIYNILNSSYFTTMWVFIFFISFMVLSFIINILQNRLNQAIRGGRK